MAKIFSLNESGEYHYWAEPFVKILNLILSLFSLAASPALFFNMVFINRFVLQS
jgi:hypothetical protein